MKVTNTLQGQQHALNQEISRLTSENQQFRQAGSRRLAEIATAAGQRFLMRTHDQMNDKVWSTLEALRNLQSSKENFSRITVLRKCVGCDIVQADHAPEAGVAQGIFHGILVRHQVKHQEKVEEGLEEEVERRVEREHSSNQTQVRMHG